MLINNGNSLHGVIAHRGASSRAPENTMAAFRQAHSDRADAIELDVVKTKDGKFVVMHDDTVDRTTNGKGAISDLTLDEIQSLDAGSWFGSKFAGERAPELGEVLDWAKGKTHVVIEVKTKTAAQSSGAELVELIRDKEVGDQVTVMSFDRKFVERVEAHAPDLDTGVLISAKASYKKAGIGAAVGAAAAGLAVGLSTGNPLLTALGSLVGLVGGGIAGRAVELGKAKQIATETTADSVMPHWTIATGGLVAAAHGGGKNVVPYTVDSPLVAAFVRGNGVDGLITNKPHQFLST